MVISITTSVNTLTRRLFERAMNTVTSVNFAPKCVNNAKSLSMLIIDCCVQVFPTTYPHEVDERS